jgi:hypothetical protein
MRHRCVMAVAVAALCGSVWGATPDGAIANSADRHRLVLPDPFAGDPALQATIVSVDVRGATRETALEAINKAARTEYKLVAPVAQSNTTPLPAPPPFDLRVERQPLLQAILQYRQMARLGVPPSRSSNQANLEPNNGSGDLGSWCVAGPMAFLATDISHRMNPATSGGGAESDDLTLRIDVMWEPKLKLTSFPQGLRLSEVVDEKGNTLLSGGPPEAYLARASLREADPNGRSQDSTLFQRLRYPRNPGRRIALLKGTGTYVAQLGSETVQITDPATAVTKKVGKWEYTIGPFQGSTSPMALPIVVQKGTASDEELASLMKSLQGLRPMLNPDDRPGAVNTRVTSQGAQTTITYTISVPPARAGGAPTVKVLTVELPGEVRRIEVPVEFRDLPLP